MEKETMKALLFQPSPARAVMAKLLSFVRKDAYWIRGSPVVYRDVPVPELPGPEWVRVKTRLAGICGSDMAAVTLKGSLDNPVRTFTSFPMYLGHEIAGEVDCPGEAVTGLHKGQRVAVYPILSCGPRGISPPCPSCGQGRFNLCRNLAEGALPPGQCIGTNNRTGGGFSEYLTAHRSQLFPVPDAVPDEHAVLLDPLCVALHAVLLAKTEPAHRVLVIGAGIIGLSVIQMIRALGIACRVYVIARHAFQKELAEQCGADRVMPGPNDPEAWGRLVKELGARQYASRFLDPFFMGGFDIIFDCVGTARTVRESLNWANHRGKVVLVGAGPSKRFEWSLLYWKEVRLIGSISFGTEMLDGRPRHAFEIVLEMMEQDRLRLDLLEVRTFRLSDYASAFKSLVEKGRTRAVKAAFDFRPPSGPAGP